MAEDEATIGRGEQKFLVGRHLVVSLHASALNHVAEQGLSDIL